ncbi:MAG: class I SAM-dependent methyltransferase [Pseudomonadota bacterium]
MKHTRQPNHQIAQLGQVFTPPPVVRTMLALLRHRARASILEPSCGDGAFFRHLPEACALELDARHAPPGAHVMDFFALAEQPSQAEENAALPCRFASIIGNPPYVRYQDIAPSTRRLIGTTQLDRRSNLYLFFIEKCLRHLATWRVGETSVGGELVFITPRDFLKASSAVPLNRALFAQGTITDFIELGDARLFAGASPNCAIWRFELGNFSRRTRYAQLGTAEGMVGLERLAWTQRRFIEHDGCLQFDQSKAEAAEAPPLPLAQIAFVKVGAVSGADDCYHSEEHGNRDFVCSSTSASGHTRRMIWLERDDPPHPALLPHKARLLARKVRRFNEHNWWHWGRSDYASQQARVYVNGKTRLAEPFFVHPCCHYDGSVLAIFPHDPQLNVHTLAAALNQVDWAALGFVCDGRFLFSQRSLEKVLLPGFVRELLAPHAANALLAAKTPALAAAASNNQSKLD